MITHLWIDMSIGKLTAVKPNISGKEVRIINLPVASDIAFIADELDVMVKHQGKDIIVDVQIQVPEY